MTPREARWLRRLQASRRAEGRPRTKQMARYALSLLIGAGWWWLIATPADDGLEALWGLEHALRWGLIASAWVIFSVHDLMLRGAADPLPKSWPVPAPWLCKSRRRAASEAALQVASSLALFFAPAAMIYGPAAAWLLGGGLFVYAVSSLLGVAALLWGASSARGPAEVGLAFYMLPAMGFAAAAAVALPVYFGGYELIETGAFDGGSLSRAAQVFLLAPALLSLAAFLWQLRSWHQNISLVKARAWDSDVRAGRGAHDKLKSAQLAASSGAGPALAAAVLRVAERQRPAGVLKSLAVGAVAVALTLQLDDGAIVAAWIMALWMHLALQAGPQLERALSEISASSVYSRYAAQLGDEYIAPLRAGALRRYGLVVALPLAAGSGSAAGVVAAAAYLGRILLGATHPLVGQRRRLADLGIGVALVLLVFLGWAELAALSAAITAAEALRWWLKARKSEPQDTLEVR